MSVIKLYNINKRYGEKEIFKNFSIEVDEGDYVSVTGPSGKGKTTLLNIMGLLEAPDKGEVTICGKRNVSFISKQTRNIRRNDVSYLFQNYGLVDTDTVKQNLKYVLRYKNYSRKQKETEMADALRLVGLDDVLNRKVYTLSGGEQQRVALAKIILKDPKIILADEPTGSLDPANRNYVLEILKMLNDKGKTIVVVTHDVEVAKCAKSHINL